MQTQKSLNKKLSEKISLWVLVFVSLIIVGLFFSMYLTSRNIFKEQIQTWNSIFPQHTLTYLVSSNNFAIEKEVDLLKLTKLFASFTVRDSQKRLIVRFGQSSTPNKHYIPIKDSAGITWGYYQYTPDFYQFFLPFLRLALICFLLIIFLYFVVRWRLFHSLNLEFKSFENFLLEIELLATKIGQLEAFSHNDFVQNKPSKSSEERRIAQTIETLISKIRQSHQQLKLTIEAAEEQKTRAKLAEVALQVAHDIRSPLATLEIIVSTIEALTEKDKRLFKESMNRIRDIANELLTKNNTETISSPSEEGKTLQLLSYVTELMVAEKRLLYKSNPEIKIELALASTAYSVFAEIQASNFKRILSNLINNAVEALEGQGNVLITLSSSKTHINVDIQDNGKGIPAHLLSKLGNFGKSFDKAEGSGLGLYHAKTMINAWGGSLSIDSQQGEGTTVSLQLVKAASPDWFSTSIEIKQDTPIVILDDDEYVHSTWSARLSKAIKAPKIIHCYTETQIREWLTANAKEALSAVFLCDYKLSTNQLDGISLIKACGIAQQSTLVTSLFNDKKIIASCQKENIQLVPKHLMSLVPIKVISQG